MKQLINKYGFILYTATQSMVCINSNITKTKVFFVHDKMKATPKRFKIASMPSNNTIAIHGTTFKVFDAKGIVQITHNLAKWCMYVTSMG